MDDSFFEAVQGPEIQQGSLDVHLTVKPLKQGALLEFDIKGTVKVTCDLCLDPMDIRVETAREIKVVLGEESLDDGEVITIARDSGILNVAWTIYEIAALEIPLRHVHEEGACRKEAREALKRLDATARMEPDPRWSKLKELSLQSKE